MVAIELTNCADGVLLPVRAQPGASKNSLRGEHQGALKVAVTKVAEKGKANKSLVEILAKLLGLKRSQIELLAGETSHDKRLLVRGVKREELAERIEAALAKE